MAVTAWSSARHHCLGVMSGRKAQVKMANDPEIEVLSEEKGDSWFRKCIKSYSTRVGANIPPMKPKLRQLHRNETKTS